MQSEYLVTVALLYVYFWCNSTYCCTGIMEEISEKKGEGEALQTNT